MADLADRFARLLPADERVEVALQVYGELGEVAGAVMLAEFAARQGLDAGSAALKADGGFVVLTNKRLVLFEDRFGPELVETASCPRDEASIRWWDETSFGSTVRHLYIRLSGGAWAYQLVMTKQLFLRRGVAGDVTRLLSSVASEAGKPAAADGAA